jgi:hypothetical protein
LANLGLASVTECRISGNSSGSIGAGGIYNDGTLALSRSVVSQNAGFAGGGIVNDATMSIVESSIMGNSTTHSGGGILNQGSMAVVRSALSENRAANGGGGVYNVGLGALSLVNSTLIRNTANFSGGSAIKNDSTEATVAIVNSTVFLSGEIRNSGGAVTLKNSILGSRCTGGPFISLDHNISLDGSCTSFLNKPSDLNFADPQLDPAGPSDNGGPTQTIALLPDSPAINAIPASDCTDLEGNSVLTDQRGVARPQGPACDIGAFEFVPTALPVAIDVKPGDEKNTINLKANGKLPVAILSHGATATATAFDATTLDPASVTLAGAHVATNGKGTPMTKVHDVDRDGRVDLLLHFNIADLQLHPDAAEAVLFGETFSGQSIRGTDSIRLVP